MKIQFAVFAIDSFGAPYESDYGLKKILDTKEEAEAWAHKDKHENPIIGRYTGELVRNNDRVIFRVVMVGKEMFKSHGWSIHCPKAGCQGD